MFKAIVRYKIFYALPVYFGYLTEGRSICCSEFWTEPVVEASLSTTTTLKHDAQYDFFAIAAAKAMHCLNHLYNVYVKHRSSDVMQLRQRGNNL